MNKKVFTLMGILLNVLYGILNASPLCFDSRYSAIKVNPNATLIIDQPISFYDGTLMKLTGATVSGSDITFADGLFEDAGNQLFMSAVFDPSGTIFLNGGDTLRVQPGKILQAVSISGIDNRIEGQPIFGGTLTLADASTTVTLALQSQVNTDVILNGGTLCLENDLAFVGSAIPLGTGTIKGNGYKLITGTDLSTWASNLIWNSDIELNSCTEFTGTFSFQEDSSINGHGNVFDITGGTIDIGPDVMLALTDIVIKGFGNNDQIIFQNDNSTLVLSNVVIEMVGSVTTSVGQVFVKGPTTVVVKDFFWTFTGTSTLTVDGVTLWKDIAGAVDCGDIIDSGGHFSLLNDGDVEYMSRGKNGGDNGDGVDSRLDLLESCCENHDSRLDEVESCCAANDSRLDVVESCCDTLNSQIEMIGPVTVFDSVLELITSCCDLVSSRVDLLESCCEGHESRLDEIEFCCDSHKLNFDLLEEYCNDNDFRIETIELHRKYRNGDNGNEVNSRLNILESRCEIHDSRLDKGESCYDFVDSRVNILASYCEDHRLRIDNLKACYEILVSQLDEVESCCHYHRLDLDLLEECCKEYELKISTIESSLKYRNNDSNVYSRLDVIESCCEVLDSRVDHVESYCEVLDSRVDHVESYYDIYESHTNVLESCCDNYESRIDTLELHYEVQDSRLDKVESYCDNLQSQVDAIISCEIRISGDVFFDLSMLPEENKTIILKFDPCFAPKSSLPHLIFDPAVYGNDGRINLARGSRLIISGEGIVEMRDGVVFDFDGTAFDPSRADWPVLILESNTQMHLIEGARVTFGGAVAQCEVQEVDGEFIALCESGGGCFVARNGAKVELNNESHLIFGESDTNDLSILFEFGAILQIEHPLARVSFHAATMEITFANHSALSILQGIVELNMLNDISSRGIITKLHFTDSSSLEVRRVGTQAGLLSFAPNFGSDPADVVGISLNFDNRTGIVHGGGDIRFRNFVGVDTTLLLQENTFAIVRPVVEVFMELSYILERGIIEAPDAVILATLGSIPDLEQTGRLVAFGPARDGSVVGLAQGDHDVFYTSSVPGGALNQIRGFDQLGNLFVINNCDESTRTPPAPLVT